MTVYEESDEYCPHCDNHYVRIHFLSICSHPTLQQVIEAKTPHAVVGVEGEDARVDARCVCWTIVALFLYELFFFSFSMLKDERVKQVHKRSIFQSLEDDLTDRTG